MAEERRKSEKLHLHPYWLQLRTERIERAKQQQQAFWMKRQERIERAKQQQKKWREQLQKLDTCTKEDVEKDLEDDEDIALLEALNLQEAQNESVSSSSSAADAKKTSKKAAMFNKTWCNVRQEKQNSKLGADTHNTNKNTSTDEDDDLPDLDEECIFVQVLYENTNDGSTSDCMIVDESDSSVISDLSPVKSSMISDRELSVNKSQHVSSTTDTGNKKSSKSYDTVSEQQSSSARSVFNTIDSEYQEPKEKTENTKMCSSTASERQGRTEQQFQEKAFQSSKSVKTLDVQSATTEKKSVVLTEEGKAKLRDIFKKANKFTSKFSSIPKKDDNSEPADDDNVKNDDKGVFNMGRHFSDFLDKSSTDSHPDTLHDTSGNAVENPLVFSKVTEKKSVNSTEIYKPVAKRLKPSLSMEKLSLNSKSNNIDSGASNCPLRHTTPPVLYSPSPFVAFNSRKEHPPLLERQISTPVMSQSTDLDVLDDKYGISPPPVKQRKLSQDCASDSAQIIKDNYRIVNLKLGKSVSLDADVPKRRIVHRTSDVADFLKDKKALSDVRNYFQPISGRFSKGVAPLFDTPRTLKDWQHVKPFNVDFPDKEGFEDSLSAMLSQIHIDTIEVCFDEEGNEYLRHAISFVHDFACKYAPTSEIVKQVLFKGLMENDQVDLIYSSYKTLKLINQKYPGSVQMNWDMLKTLMDNLNLGIVFSQQKPYVLLRTSLFLQLMVQSYENELYNKDVVDPKGLRQSLAYRSLTSDCTSQSGSNIKQIINWMVSCLTWGEFEEVQEISSVYLREREQHDQGNQGPHETSERDPILRQEVRKLLPMFQRLLNIAIEVSLSCSDCARTCALELLKSFPYQGLNYKKLLLQTMQSSLLQFKLVSLMLENYCDAVSYYEFPSSICDVVENYFHAQPPVVISTPPTTPQSEEDEDIGEGAQGGRNASKVSPVSVEELAMLHYYVLRSYLQCARCKSHLPLRVRMKSLDKEFGKISVENTNALEKLPYYIEELRAHYLGLSVDLTQGTEQYLMMMLCLTDVVPNRKM